jgi:transcriptional regulator with XRE-family HTH domain
MSAPGPRKPRPEGAQNALGEFLRARRRLVAPEEVGIPTTGRRRAPWLRREELATLAGVSSPYYIRLEQGRDRHPSPQVVDALGRALRLDDETFAYFKRLAGQVPNGTPPHSGHESVRSGIAQLVHSLQDVAALVVGCYRDVLDANRLAQALHVGYTPGQNLLRFLFLDPRAPERVIDWEEVARQAVAALRADSSANVDPHLRQLTADLSRHSAQFRDLWNRHDATTFTTGQIRFNNPLVGPITLSFESFPVPGARGQSLGIAFPTAGGADEQKLRDLKKLAENERPT